MRKRNIASKQPSHDDLANQATEMRRLALAMIYAAGSGHPGGSLSCIDLLSYLVSTVLDWAPAKMTSNRDRFILSKGHACPALYAAAIVRQLVSHKELFRFRQLGGILQGHPHVLTTPWAETSTGSLGQGFSVAIGLALGLRHQGQSSRVYAMLGDGELQEGEVWEGAMCAAHHRLDRLCAIIDYNKMQSDDLCKNIMGVEPLKGKWEMFNWRVIEIDGHDFADIARGFEEARKVSGQPTAVIAHTVKGRGVSYMEGSPAWHGSVSLRAEELRSALRELDTSEEDIRRYLGARL